MNGDSIALSSPLKFRTAFNEFGGYCIPVSATHRPAAQAVIGGGVWEPDTIAFMIDACRGGDIVHAGTFFGDFLPALAKAAPTVWAFEPSLENWRCANLTGALNGLTNIRLFLGGLSDHTGHMALRTQADDGVALGGASHLVDHAMADTEIAPVATLDSILPPNRPIAVLQLDVEGHEQRALSGAIETVRRWKPVLILETMPRSQWIDHYLAPLGYSVRRSLHVNTVLSVNL